MPSRSEDAADLFDAEYYRTELGSPYERNGYWLDLFGTIAEEIIRSLQPRTVLDAGCALGFLVESLWDRGVEAYGFDVSEFGISQIRRDIQPYCRQASIIEPIDGHYDLITCIEVLEHIPPQDTEAAIASLTAATETILFSSTPSDLSQPTHFNVRPIIGWLNLFKNAGFWPDYAFDAGFVSPHAILFRKKPALAEDAFLLLSEKIRWKGAYVERQSQNTVLNQTVAELRTTVANEVANQEVTRVERDQLAGQLDDRNHEVESLKCEIETLRMNEQSFLQAQRDARIAVLEAQRDREMLLRRLDDADIQLRKIDTQVSRAKAEAATLALKLAESQTALAALKQDAQDNKEIDPIAIAVLGGFFRRYAELQFRYDLPAFRNLLSQLVKQAKLALSRQRSTLRKQQLRMLDQMDIILPSLLFDPAFYLKTYTDVSEAALNPLVHFLEFGAAEGRQIGTYFDVQWYGDHNPDVVKAGVNPLVHYLQNGSAEGRNPGPEFDAEWYLNHYPDVANYGGPALSHYLRFGLKEGRRKRSVGETEQEPMSALTESTSDADELLHLQRELLAASPLFNSDWYRDQYPDVAEAGLDPIVHYLQHGSAEGRSPGPEFDGEWYLNHNPDVAAGRLNPLLHYLEYGSKEGREIRAPIDPHMVHVLLHNQFADSMPMAVFAIPRGQPRVTIVTDSINTGSLFGGVGTSLILSTLLAKELGASLRLVTRREPPSTGNFGDILSVNGIAWDEDIEFVHADINGGRSVAVSESDFFITTSWWTTRSVRNAVDPSRIFYLLQEDERMFYPYGDQRLRCEETLKDSSIRIVVNSELLFEHLARGAEPCHNIERDGLWFEPAFPASNYYPDQAAEPASKKKFFFYARPNNSRNLYWRGLETITAAIESGVLGAQDWQFHFVGRTLERVILPGNATVKLHQNLSWSEYAALVRKMDLALCLMDTPHPSYPPLDLAASGAVVVTNRRGSKTSLSQYSNNIICSDPTVESLQNAMGTAVQIMNDPANRSANYSTAGLLRDWNLALAPLVQRIATLIRSAGA